MSLTETLWNVVAPYDCLGCGVEGLLICEACWPGLFTPVTTGPGVIVTTNYQGLARALVRAMKIDCCRQACKLIALALHQTAPTIPKDAVVTSVPTASARIRERGFDHSRLIAREFSRLRGLEYRSLLVRHGKSKQAGATRAVRAQQVVGKYQLRPKRADIPDRVLIIDDVMTTGATMNEVLGIVSDNGAKPVGLVFAKR